MKTKEVLAAWRGILAGRAPSISIEITKECPLRCPGCYAFDAAHLGGGTTLRELSDFKGDDLVSRILALVDRHKPLHVSLVGGDPLVRYRGGATPTRDGAPWRSHSDCDDRVPDHPCGVAELRAFERCDLGRRPSCRT